METVFFDKTKVTKVYRGKDRHCRCGCGGNYFYRNELKDNAFEQNLNEFEKKLIKYICREGDVGDNYLNVSYGKNSALTVYFD